MFTSPVHIITLSTEKAEEASLHYVDNLLLANHLEAVPHFVWATDIFSLHKSKR